MFNQIFKSSVLIVLVKVLESFNSGIHVVVQTLKNSLQEIIVEIVDGLFWIHFLTLDSYFPDFLNHLSLYQSRLIVGNLEQQFLLLFICVEFYVK